MPPIQIAVPDADLELLHKKLELVRFPDELEGVGWDYGVPLEDVERLVARWRDGYDWRKHEAELNQLPQFTRDIEVDGFGTLNIHYVHQRSTQENAIPLLFVHGWPGSFIEARKIIPLLTSESSEHPSFHVVVYSLPAFGFSEAPRKPGFAIKQYAEIGLKLMQALGYNEFVTQGGDWGQRVTRRMATLYGPKHVKAWHTNFTHTDTPSFTRSPLAALQHAIHESSIIPFSPYTEFEKKGFKRNEWFEAHQAGYYTEQNTQPQTLGYALADSPVGLLAWIYEKLVLWSDKYQWDDDEVLTWISIYWFSRAGPAASLRIYYEAHHAGDIFGQPYVSAVPMGVSYFPAELFLAPISWMKATGQLVFTAHHESGGHFAAHEKPEVLVDDLRKMFGKGGPAHGVVPGKTGYA
ncbi:alpha/beta-hydrolase [Gloeophyllum trabeum ATCC 11539]|uniref:Alpha/beta-hydrolase n=1 Tax=Gloeophyllum trabeum (strain ATCC 11539 / FP-39264 / Madison 617) TaxID=670483 RepID=S7RJY9_GLOTA|nr:alpha/beta-hydrolase [Gloeophyllum trabeum ATCC 11539]EPQ54695.1 alpha/beta-hydrolase [Gloeophyllum trabeum ATCC 11539]